MEDTLILHVNKHTCFPYLMQLKKVPRHELAALQKTRLAFKLHLFGTREDIIAGVIDSAFGDLTAGVGVDGAEGSLVLWVPKSGRLIM
ncbi:hypothetical protein BELL_0419g00080 [Botrytis elliptica]|uniref:Uncharacterized protein n=1 Tax=Botrytis elliptica TaxID=278938 RepID=A0A4Z1JH25_9HELO|nr:hypothetical protein EAE99_004030 [Botrytis elliptica]TGO72786.1 hypothetical protein BELL_0419g00080 [Botrytis elliptica]